METRAGAAFDFDQAEEVISRNPFSESDCQVHRPKLIGGGLSLVFPRADAVDEGEPDEVERH